MECKRCKIQYVGKSETSFNLRLNNHRKDVTRKSIPASNHFDDKDHKFERDAKFILIEKLKTQNADKEILRKRLKVRENFWILKLETLHPKGLNRELNNI